jgi:hypothetical protein
MGTSRTRHRSTVLTTDLDGARLLSGFDRTYGPGWVSEEGHWQRSDNACQSSQFIQRFRDTPSSKYIDEFPTLVNKTMFILGDSVGRQLWDQLCFEIGAPKNVRYPPGVEPAVHYSEASVCIQPELNFTIVGFHQYGESSDHVLDLAHFRKRSLTSSPIFL